MTERGLPIVDGAPACPFVAFEDDRDERATSPDHRHRCYAEVEPAPRALAHQEAYCLSSAFPVCPTFQDWARREAARARSLDAPSDDDGDRDLPPLVAERPPHRPGDRRWASPPPWSGSRAGGAQEPRDAGVDDERGGPRPDEDESDDAEMGGNALEDGAAAGAAAGGAAGAAAGGLGGGLSGSFADRLAGGGPAPRPDGPRSDATAAPPPRSSDDLRPRRDDASRSYPPLGEDDDGSEVDEGDEPPRGPRRRERETAPVAAARRAAERERDLDAPAWERPRRLEAYPTIRSRGFGLGASSVLVAALAILLAGVLLFLLPGFLGVGGPPAGTPRPTGLGGTAAPSSSVAPTVPAAPTATVYLVQPGDTMSKIAKKFGIPLATLIEVNKTTIPNPDQLQIGDAVTIPVSTPTELPAAS